MWLRASRALRLAALAATALVAGCGFHLAGTVGHLPPQMQAVYLDSGQPYGGLENDLRRAIVSNGGRMVDDADRAQAVLDIMATRQRRRVLAVDARGHPQEYALTYEVQYRMVDAHGHELLAPTTIKLRRDLAYSVNIELGAGRRQQELVGDMQQEAVRLILLRLQALGAHPPATAAGPAPATGARLG